MTVKRKSWRILFCLSFLLSACAAPGPPFSSVSLPPIPANSARMYFYRDYEPYESLTEPWISLNGQETCLSVPGGVSYRDLPPGAYHITVLSPGIYPNQFKTVRLSAGDSSYVKIESLYSWYQGLDWAQDTFVVALIDPATATAEMATMRFVACPS